MGPISCSGFIRREKLEHKATDTQGNHHVTTETETGARNAKDVNTTKGKEKARFLLTPHVDVRLLVYRIAREYISVCVCVFKATGFVVFLYGSPRKQKQWYMQWWSLVVVVFWWLTLYDTIMANCPYKHFSRLLTFLFLKRFSTTSQFNLAD